MLESTSEKVNKDAEAVVVGDGVSIKTHPLIGDVDQTLAETPTTDPAMKQQQRKILTALLVTYFGFFFVRSPMSVTVPTMLAATSVSRYQLGIIYSVAYFFQASGKILSGYFTDKLGGRPVILYGLMGSIVMCSSIGMVGLGHSQTQTGVTTVFALLLILWSINRLFQSSAWSAILKILGNFYEEKYLARVVGLFALSYGFGDALIRLILGSILSAPGSSWWIVWFSASGCAAAIWVSAYFSILSAPRSSESILETDRPSSEVAQGAVESPWNHILDIVKRLDFWIPAIMYICMTFIRETILSWTSVIISDVFHTSNEAAGTLSLVVPLSSAVAAIIGGYITDRTQKKWHIIVMCINMTLLIVCLVTLLIQLESPESPRDVVLGLVNLAIIAFFLEGPYTFIDGVYSLRLGGKKSGGMAVGVVQALGYTGGIAAGSLTGAIVEGSGWLRLFQVLLGVSGFVLFLTIVLAFILRQRE